MATTLKVYRHAFVPNQVLSTTMQKSSFMKAGAASLAFVVGLILACTLGISAQAASSTYFNGNLSSGQARTSTTRTLSGGENAAFPMDGFGLARGTVYIQTAWESVSYLFSASAVATKAKLRHAATYGFSRCFWSADSFGRPSGSFLSTCSYEY